MHTNPRARAVAEDAAREAGKYDAWRVRWLFGMRPNAYANADANADAYANANANADADADAYANANADADANANAYANADADAYADANAYANANAKTTAKEKDMRDGLFAVQLWSGNLMVLRVGWFQRLDGDDYAVSWSTPYRGEYSTRLGDVWSVGPKAAPNWTWGPPLDCDVTRLQVVPLARLDPAKWEKICPQPKWWVEK